MAIVQVEVADVSVLAIPKIPKEMISVGERNGKTFVRINYSSMDVIQNCLRKAKYLLEERWKPQDESTATLFGSAFHKALEVFYAGEISERKIPKLDTMELMSFGNRVDGDESDLCLRATRAFIEAAAPLAPLSETDKHSIYNGMWILHSYFRAYIDDPYVAYRTESGEYFVEKKFSLVVHEDDSLIIELFGTIDVVLRHVTTGDLIPADHKTAGFLNFGGSSYFDREKPNHQYTGYLLGAREVLGIDTNRFMVNIVEKKSKPKTEKAKGVSFPRQITERNEDDFADFREALLHTVRSYLTAKKTDNWPQGPTGACTAYGSCSYRSVCSVPKNMRETLLNNKFAREV
jgi:hypothetical protein